MAFLQLVWIAGGLLTALSLYSHVLVGAHAFSSVGFVHLLLAPVMLRGTYSVSFASLVCTPAQTRVLVYSTHVPSQAFVKHSQLVLQGEAWCINAHVWCTVDRARWLAAGNQHGMPQCVLQGV
jgi:hypothetical protein